MQQFFRGAGWWFQCKWVCLQGDALGCAASPASAESEPGILAGRAEKFGSAALLLVQHLVSLSFL